MARRDSLEETLKRVSVSESLCRYHGFPRDSASDSRRGGGISYDSVECSLHGAASSSVLFFDPGRRGALSAECSTSRLSKTSRRDTVCRGS